MGFLKEFGKTLHCFFDWPMLHTRVITYGYISWAMYEIDQIRKTNSDTALHKMFADGLMWGLIFIILFYVSKSSAETLLNIAAARFGVQTTIAKEKTTITTEKKVENVDPR